MQTSVVHGLGGIGKTQLAVEYAWKHLCDYDAVFWVKADSSEALDGGLAALASLLRLPEAAEGKQAVQTKAVLDWLQGHERWLLIADNADTDEAARALCERLPPSLLGQVLITSRISDWPVNIQDLALDLLSPDYATRYLLDRVATKRHNAGDEAAARSVAEELGNLPLALEQAASFIVEMRWSFAKYQEQFRDARPELLSEHREGGTRYPASVAKTWRITLAQLSPPARSLLRIAAWFAPDTIPRSVFSALGRGVTASNLAIEKALGELAKFSFIRLTAETVSIHPLLQAIEQDSLGEDERKRLLPWAGWLLNASLPAIDDHLWATWRAFRPHAETLIEHAKRNGVDSSEIGKIAHDIGLFLFSVETDFEEAEALIRHALAILERQLGADHLSLATVINSLRTVLWLQDVGDGNTNNAAEIESLFSRELTIREKALNPEHPDVATCLETYALMLRKMGRPREAEPLEARARAIRTKSA